MEKSTVCYIKRDIINQSLYLPVQNPKYCLQLNSNIKANINFYLYTEKKFGLITNVA